MFSERLISDLSVNKELMIVIRELLFEFVDKSDDLLKKYGLKTKLEYDIGISNRTFWCISHRKEHPLPSHYFLNRFWQKFFQIIYYTFYLLDNEHMLSNFQTLEKRYCCGSEARTRLYMTVLICWMLDNGRSGSHYSSLLNTGYWKSLLEEPDYDEFLQNLSGKDESGNGLSGEA